MANLLFREEFSGPLDMTLAENGQITYEGKWQPHRAHYYWPDRGYCDWASSGTVRSTWLLNPNQTIAGQKRSAFSVSNGVLRIECRTIPSSWNADIWATMQQPWAPSYPSETQSDWMAQPSWAGGLLVSNPRKGFQFTTGYLEFRARFPNPGRGMFPALWAYASEAAENSGKNQAELDVFEVFGHALGRPQTGAVHMKNNNVEVRNSLHDVYSINEDTSGWNTYGIERTSGGTIRFYKNGVVRYTLPTNDANWFSGVPMDIKLNYCVNPVWLGGTQWTDGSTPNPLYMEVDYVRVWDAFTQEEPPPEDPGNGNGNGGGDPDPPITLTPSASITTTQNGQVIEDLEITTNNWHGIFVNGHSNVTIRNCRIVIHSSMDSHGDFGAAINASGGNISGLNIEGVEIVDERSWTPHAQRHYGMQIHGPSGSLAQNVHIDRVRMYGLKGGIQARRLGTNCVIEHVENKNARGPFPRGQAIQIDACNGLIFRHFRDHAEPQLSFTEDNVNVIDSSNITVRDGVCIGNNSPSGIGLLVEGSSNVLFEDCDVAMYGNGATNGAINSSNVTYRRIRARDGINVNPQIQPTHSNSYTAQNVGVTMWNGQPTPSWQNFLGSAILTARTGGGNAQSSNGSPSSGGEAFIAYLNSGPVTYENCIYWNPSRPSPINYFGNPGSVTVIGGFTQQNFALREPEGLPLVMAWEEGGDPPPPTGEPQVVRPVATVSAGNWTAQPSGTLHGVTSDEDDATHAQLLSTGSPSAMELTLAAINEVGPGTGRIVVRARTAPPPAPSTFGPTSIISNPGVWTAQGGGTIPGNLGTATRNDATAARSTNENPSAITLGFGQTIPAGNYTLRYTYRRMDTGGTNPGFEIRLLNGGTQIGTWSHTPTTTTWQIETQSVTIPAGGADSVELIRSGGGSASNRRPVEVSWVQLEAD